MTAGSTGDVAGERTMQDGRDGQDAQLISAADGPSAYLGESPRWDGDAWWWVDAKGGEVWTRTPGHPARLAWHPGRRTSLVHPEASGRVVVACEQRLYVLDRLSGTRRAEPLEWCDLGLGDGWLVNDGVADAAGRLWIGAIAPDRAPLGGVLLRVEPDGTVSTAAQGFTLTNGMAWDEAGKVVFHVDTYEKTVWAHHVDVVSGDVLSSETFLDFDDDDGMPDGIATDVAGGLWVAMYRSGQARRYDASARLDRTVRVQAPQCTSIEIGGPDGRDILITTGREGYDDARAAAEPLAGRLFAARSPYVGVPKPKAVVNIADAA